MKTRAVIVYSVFFMLLSALLCLNMLNCGNKSTPPQYTTEINRLLIGLSDDWESICAGNGVNGHNEDFDYAVTDAKGKLLFSTREDMSLTVSAATGRIDIIRDIERDGEVLGRLIVRNPYEEIRRAADRRTAGLTGGITLIMLAVSIGYYIWLRKRIIEPFGKLEGFAEKVAAGDLETPLDMDKGNIFGAFTESFDIMREELRASRLREEAAVKSRKEMIAELSHDVRTPVASIKAMSEFLELTADNDAQKETLSAINSKADQIDKLVSNLFHATLEELEQLEVRPEELPSSELVQIVTESDHLKKVTVCEIDDCVINADRLRLTQVVGNIISNSYKYADTDITVSSFFENDCLIVEFSDKGGGVPDDEIEVITEKFRRGSNAEGKDGSGIGLYISAYLMSKMDGELVCRNNGEGFTVGLRFRLA